MVCKKVIRLDRCQNDYLSLIKPPKSKALKSGLVTLGPNRQVGRHNTDNYEELLIILEGKGRVLVWNEKTVKIICVAANTVVYLPPFTEHDVCNNECPRLRYIYVVCDTNI